jgi:RimJ/RimL family protein N-acetyltransferase
MNARAALFVLKVMTSTSAATLFGQRVVLRDGTTAVVRPVHYGDAPVLIDGFARMSVRSRWLRFLMSKHALSPAEVRFLTDVDHLDHEAILAIDPADGRGMGIARYVRDRTDPHAAEIAVTVVDEWQRRGLGTELINLLIVRALRAGIQRFTALASADNEGIAQVLRRVCAVVTRAVREFDTIDYELALLPVQRCSESVAR